MGSGSSKKASASSSSSCCCKDDLGRNKEERKKREPLFSSSCFGSHHKAKKKEINGKSKHITCKVQIQPNGLVLNSEDSAQIPNSNSQLSEENREMESCENSIPGCSTSKSKPKSRFRFTQGNVSLRLNRALSLGSSHSLFSTNNDHNVNTDTSLNNINNTSDNLSDENVIQPNSVSQTRINDNIDITDGNNVVQVERNLYRNRTTNRNQDTIDHSVRFSRTLSVGRLRDRVLRRTPFSDGIFSPIISDEITGINARRALRRAGSYSHNMHDLISDGNDVNVTNYENESENNRELLERRSAFLERRRRIRSQVRALQRLGSRFENLTGHERSCVLSGRHRTDSCTCRSRNNRTGTGTGTGTGNSDDDSATTTSSISRIVMLAEALFEVLDEIHQQSVVLSSSRQSFSSIGSVPAPKETVESLPVKFYKKNPKNNEDISQCYICLVEYEEGDGMRVLPCNHEFHLTCVDKWLKEIHRVCPLCRGDVCRAGTSIVGKMN